MCIRPFSFVATKSGKEELVVALNNIQYKSEHMVSITEVIFDNTHTCLNIKLPPHETMPDNEDDNLEAMAITIQPEDFHFVYDLLCIVTNNAQVPGWRNNVIKLLKKATLYTEWMHALKKGGHHFDSRDS